MGRLLPLLTIAVLLAALPLRADALDSEIIQVRYRTVQELVPIVSPLLGPAGRISADPRTNSLIVIDTAEAIDRIARLVQQLDQPPVALRIDVRFGRRQSANEQTASAEGSLSGDGWQVSSGDGEEDGLHVRLQDRSRRQDQTARVSVSTVSGSPAYIRYGTEIPYLQRAAGVCRRYGGCPPTVAFYRVETGFWVTPRIAGDRIDLVIVPQVADLASGQRVRFAAASVHQAVYPDRWTEIGGVQDRQSSALSEILGASDTGRRGSLSISVKVERLDGQSRADEEKR
jgi:hypothetical protein